MGWVIFRGDNLRNRMLIQGLPSVMSLFEANILTSAGTG